MIERSIKIGDYLEIDDIQGEGGLQDLRCVLLLEYQFQIWIFTIPNPESNRELRF